MNTINKIKSLIATLFFFLSTNVLADWPVATVDEVTAHTSQISLTLDVLENDVGHALKVVAVNDWTENGGRVSINESSPTIQYTPPFDASIEEDGFWYVIEDSQGRKNAARVSVNLLSLDDELLPVPQGDNVTTAQNTSIRIDVISNDLFTTRSFNRIGNIGDLVSTQTQTDKGGIAKIILYPDAPAFSRKPQILYTPPKDFIGTDTFEYTARDGFFREFGTQEKQATVTVNVTNSDNINIVYPTGTPDIFSYDCSDTACRSSEIDVLSNDTGGDLVLRLNSAYSLNAGQVQLIPRTVGQPYLLYTPAEDFSGEDTVWYVLEDEFGRQNWSVLTIHVNRD